VLGRRITLSRRVREDQTSWTIAPFCVGRVTVRPSDAELRRISGETGNSKKGLQNLIQVSLSLRLKIITGLARKSLTEFLGPWDMRFVSL
jgi:hypothetical protein